MVVSRLVRWHVLARAQTESSESRVPSSHSFPVMGNQTSRMLVVKKEGTPMEAFGCKELALAAKAAGSGDTQWVMLSIINQEECRSRCPLATCLTAKPLFLNCVTYFCLKS